MFRRIVSVLMVTAMLLATMMAPAFADSTRVCNNRCGEVDNSTTIDNSQDNDTTIDNSQDNDTTINDNSTTNIDNSVDNSQDNDVTNNTTNNTTNNVEQCTTGNVGNNSTVNQCT